MKVWNREIDPDQPTFVIAEAGTSHFDEAVHARVSRAEHIVKQIGNIGPDAIKFQAFVSEEELFCAMDGDEDRAERWNMSILRRGEWWSVRHLAHRHNMAFILSTFQHEAVKMGSEIPVDAFKVASRALETFPYEDVNGPLIISVPDDIPMSVIQRMHKARLDWKLLHCDPIYPCKMSPDTHGRAGLSDHSGSPWPAIGAILGDGHYYHAEIVEVHVKVFDREEVDDKVAVSLDELKMICDARDAEYEMRQG